ncbi:MAG: hypothetical protein V3S68_00910 [Dehalococcoidia bacterium]
MTNHVDKDPAAHFFNADCRPGVDYANTCYVCGGPKEGHKLSDADQLFADHKPNKKKRGTI